MAETEEWVLPIITDVEYQFPENIAKKRLQKILKSRNIIRKESDSSDTSDMVVLFKKHLQPLPQREHQGKRFFFNRRPQLLLLYNEKHGVTKSACDTDGKKDKDNSTKVHSSKLVCNQSPVTAKPVKLKRKHSEHSEDSKTKGKESPCKLSDEPGNKHYCDESSVKSHTSSKKTEKDRSSTELQRPSLEEETLHSKSINKFENKEHVSGHSYKCEEYKKHSDSKHSSSKRHSELVEHSSHHSKQTRKNSDSDVEILHKNEKSQYEPKKEKISKITWP